MKSLTNKFTTGREEEELQQHIATLRLELIRLTRDRDVEMKIDASGNLSFEVKTSRLTREQFFNCLYKIDLMCMIKYKSGIGT